MKKKNVITVLAIVAILVVSALNAGTIDMIVWHMILGLGVMYALPSALNPLVKSSDVTIGIKLFYYGYICLCATFYIFLWYSSLDVNAMLGKAPTYNNFAKTMIMSHMIFFLEVNPFFKRRRMVSE